jgi:hypothetical protein
MVHHGVFTEYRDARFMREFYEDSEKWALLKTFEPGIANRLAKEISAGTSNLGTRITNLPEAIKKTLVAKPDALNTEHLEQLHESVQTLASYLTDSSSFRMQLTSFKKSLKKATIEDLEAITVTELDEVITSIQRVRALANQPNIAA